MTVGVNEINLHNQRNNPNPKSSNYFQALLAINPHNRTPKQRYDSKQMNPRHLPIRMNANNAVVNGPADLQNIYGNNKQPNNAFCYRFQERTCPWGDECKFVHEMDPSGQAGKPRYKEVDNNKYRGQEQYERGRKRERTPEREDRYSSSR